MTRHTYTIPYMSPQKTVSKRIKSNEYMVRDVASKCSGKDHCSAFIPKDVLLAVTANPRKQTVLP